MNKSVKQDVLQAMEERSVAPKRKVYFISRNLTFWLLAITSTVVGAVAFSQFIAVILVNQTFTGFSSLMDTMPLFWLSILVVFTIFAWRNVKSTNQLYNQEHAVVIVGTILFSMLLGMLLFMVNLHSLISYSFYSNSQMYNSAFSEYLDKRIEVKREQDILDLYAERERMRSACLEMQMDHCIVDGRDINEIEEDKNRYEILDL